MRRNNLDICADIIEVAEGGAKKTELVYKCNLNFKIIKKYLEKLIELKLIEKRKNYYFSTAKGIDFLYQYREFIAPIKGELELTNINT